MTEHVPRVPDEEAPPTGPSLSRRWPYVVGAAVLFAIALLLPLVSTLQPSYYERYPELRDRVNNWSTSTHGRMSCASCHIQPGARGILSFAAHAIPAYYSRLLNGPHEENVLQAPDHITCQTCHTRYRQVSADGDLLIPHRAHVEILEIDCVVCHRDLVHTGSPEGFNRPSMKTCLGECHDGEIAGDECLKCHTRKHVPDDHLSDDWLEIHTVMADTIDCGSCHAWTPDYCDECHSKRPATHVGNWRKDHATRARTHSDGCMVCHGGEQFCEECH